MTLMNFEGQTRSSKHSNLHGIYLKDMRNFLGQIEKESFEIPKLDLKYSNMFRDLYPMIEVYCDYKIIKAIVQLNGKEPITYKKNNFPEKQLRDTKKYRDFINKT